MRKILIVCIVCQCFATMLPAQSKENLQKYWYYRARLKNFVKVSANTDEAGTNIPFAEIQGDWIKSDDGNNAFNQYISVLATEYRLLKNYHQDYTQTIQELYYALKSLERLDATAEQYYRPSHTRETGDLNGFFVRDDFTLAFWNKYKFGGSEPYFKTSHIAGEEKQTFLDVNPYNYNNENSQDNCWHYLESLSLVNQLVDYEWVDGVGHDFKQMAKDMTRRMIGNMYHPEAAQNKGSCGLVDGKSYCQSVMSLTWYVKNPATNKYVPEGNGTDGSVLLTSYGFAQSANRLIGQDVFAGMDKSEFAFKQYLQAPVNDLYLAVSYFPHLCAGPTIMPDVELVLHGTGYYLTIMDFFPGPFGLFCTTGDKTFENLYHMSLKDYPARSFCATGNISAGSLNAYQWLIRKQNDDGPYKYEHLPLIWSVLNTTQYITSQDRQFVADLLNSAPACGPYSFGPDDNSGDWSCDSRLVCPQNNRCASDCGNKGTFNGLDYMLLHNLYWLTNPVAVPQDVSSVPSSGTVTATRDVSTSQTIQLNGNTVQIYAGNSVTLQPGFETTGSGNFNVDISDVTTNATTPVYYRKIPITDYQTCPDNRLRP